MIHIHRLWQFLAAVALAACLSADAARAAEKAVQSGLQPGEQILAIFEPLNVTGPYAGQPHCLVCENGANPVAMVFARSLTEPTVLLLKHLDAATAKYRQHELGTFVVFLDDNERLIPRLQETAKKQSLKHTILATDLPAGPDGFKVAEEADLTVVLYREHEVLANHAFRKGELDKEAIQKILADLPRLVNEK